MDEINGIKISSSYLRITQEIGTILFAEFPTTILLIDNNNQLLIQEWADCSENGKTDRYYYYKTDEINIARFLKYKISHLDLIRNSTDGLVYFQDQDQDNLSEFTILSANQIPTSYLPSPNYRLKENDIVDFQKIDKYLNLTSINTEIDIRDTLKNFAKFKKSEIYNLHIKKGNGVGYGTIKSETLGKTLLNFENLYENVALDILIGKQRGSIDLKSNSNKEKLIFANSEVVSSMAASFNLLIRPHQSELSLYDELSSSEKIAHHAFSLLNNSVESEKLKDEYLLHSEYTISAYKGLLKEITTLELDIEISWFSDKKEINFSQKLNSSLANKIALEIDTFNVTNEDNFSKKGKFRAINCDTGHYTFISNEEELFTGYFDKQIKKGSELIVFTKIYELSIQRKIIKDASKDTPQIKDTAIGFFEFF
jgi:hypothetical protein